MSSIDLSHLTDQHNPVLFISDLHLDAESAAKLALSLQFFTFAQSASALFIVGDLFEYWLGDDAPDPRLQSVYDAIAAVSASGTAIHIMHGNRDFLLGEHFAERVGATVHQSDVLNLTLCNQTVSVVHGDTLCTDDTDYQALRKLVRDPHWQNEFLALSIEERIAKAQALRDKSRDATADKQATIMDVNALAVSAHCVQFPCDCLIHGHTHRPAEHVVPIQETSAATDAEQAKPLATRRLVLGDWKDDHTHIAVYDGRELKLTRYNAQP